MDKVQVTFVFESEDDKEEFLGQLTDGFGENYVSLEWEGHIDDAKEIRVLMEDDYLDAWEDESNWWNDESIEPDPLFS